MVVDQWIAAACGLAVAGTPETSGRRHGDLEMANFFTDNEDIQFLFDSHRPGRAGPAAGRRVRRTPSASCDYCARRTRPTRSTTTAGSWKSSARVAGEMIAPNAEQIDREGNTLNPDGTVTYHPLVQQNLDRLTQADMMGFHPAVQVRRAELPQPGLHHGHRDHQPGRLLADEPVRPARASPRRSTPSPATRSRTSAAAVRPGRSDRRHGADRARRRQRLAGGAAAGPPGRAGQLASSTA